MAVQPANKDPEWTTVVLVTTSIGVASAVAGVLVCIEYCICSKRSQHHPASFIVWIAACDAVNSGMFAVCIFTTFSGLYLDHIAQAPLRFATLASALFTIAWCLEIARKLKNVLAYPKIWVYHLIVWSACILDAVETALLPHDCSSKGCPPSHAFTGRMGDATLTLATYGAATMSGLIGIFIMCRGWNTRTSPERHWCRRNLVLSLAYMMVFVITSLVNPANLFKSRKISPDPLFTIRLCLGVGQGLLIALVRFHDVDAQGLRCRGSSCRGRGCCRAAPDAKPEALAPASHEIRGCALNCPPEQNVMLLTPPISFSLINSIRAEDSPSLFVAGPPVLIDLGNHDLRCIISYLQMYVQTEIDMESMFDTLPDDALNHVASKPCDESRGNCLFLEPWKFRSLRQKWGFRFSDKRDAFSAGLGVHNVKRTRGKSAAFFIRCPTARVIFKIAPHTKTGEQVKSLVTEYYDYVTSVDSSLLCRLYGAMVIQLHGIGTVSVVLMEQVRPRLESSLGEKAFDIKGRPAGTEERNLRQIVQENPAFDISLLRSDSMAMDLLEADLNFLVAAKRTDYSLLVLDGTACLIDYLQDYDLLKQGESAVKRIYRVVGMEQSVLPPSAYANRMLEFVRSVREQLPAV